LDSIFFSVAAKSQWDGANLDRSQPKKKIEAAFARRALDREKALTTS
jgi:hypothetical protein